MSIWKILNWVAWGLSAVLLLVMLWDFLKTERQARRPGKQTQSDETGKPEA